MFFFYFKRRDPAADHGIDPRAVIARLMPFSPPDKSGFLAKGHDSLLVQCVFWNTPQSRFEKAPTMDAAGRIQAAAWARLDNREELAQKLTVSLPNLKTMSDTELILQSYLKWRENCVDHLIGDFVFVIYDSESRKVFCSRDHMGVRPFYYYLSDDVFVCATSLAAMLDVPGVPVKIREQWVAEYLVHLSMSFEDTCYEGIKKLPPAHCLAVTEGSARLWPYFQLCAEPELKLADSREYADAYRDVLETAVKCRLVSEYDIGCELSGGVDSSTVTAFAAKLLGDALPRLHTFAFAFSELEPKYIQEVIDACRLPDNHIISERQQNQQEVTKRSLALLGYPVEHANATFHEPFYQLAEKLNTRVLLSGFGGDEFGTTIHGNLVPLEMIVKRRYRELFHILPGNPLYRFLRLIKMEWRRRKTHNFHIPAFNPRFLAAFKQRWPHCIVRDDLVRRYHLEERYFDTARFDAGYTDLKRFTLEKRWMPFVPTRMENGTLMAAGRKIEYSWPLLDVRLVKLFLSIPSRENFYRGTGRHLHRRACNGVVPKMALWKQGKDMGAVMDPQEREKGALSHVAIDDLHPALHQYIDMEKLRKQLAEMPSWEGMARRDNKKMQFSRNVRAVADINAWLKYPGILKD